MKKGCLPIVLETFLVNWLIYADFFFWNDCFKLRFMSYVVLYNLLF